MKSMKMQGTDIYKYTDQKLKAHVQNTPGFLGELDNLFEHYKFILQPKIKEADYGTLDTSLNEAVNGQVFNGYFMFQEFLNADDTEIADEWFQNSKGAIAQEMPSLLRNITGGNIEEVITNNPLKKMASWLVAAYEDVFPTLMDLSLNAACMGAKWAVYDEAEKRGIIHYNPQTNGKLAFLDDVSFINPESFIIMTAVNEKSEIWEIIKSYSHDYEKIGEVTLLETAGNPDAPKYYMNISIISNLPEGQQEGVVYTLSSMFLERQNADREQLTLTVSMVNEFLYVE